MPKTAREFLWFLEEMGIVSSDGMGVVQEGVATVAASVARR